ncbi:GDP-mannose 4,6-dehydratase [Candidatus Parcubacteria bacterium]|nr:GDP-mannose 4,6-dehydratase [Candidatus Parcubacteria bacterium]
MKTVLITGGAGFIGSHLCEHLLRDPKVKRVVCIDNLDPTYPVKYKKENLSLLLPSKKFKFYKKDIRDRKALEAIFKKEKPDYVVHLAAKTDTRSSVHEAAEHESVNILGTLNIFDLAKDHKVKKVVFFSSSSVYGNTAKPPFKETDMLNFPLAPYGATKIAGEVLAYTYFFNFGLPIVCFRIFNAYGPRLRPSLVLYKWVESIMGGKVIEMSGTGTRKRDFTYVGDIVEAVDRALKADVGYEIVNVGNSSPITLKELLRIIEKVTRKKALVKSRPSSKASVELTYADVSKAKKVLGWKPKTSMEKGVSIFVDWFKENRL